MPSQFGGVEVSQPAASGSSFGGIPVDAPDKPSIVSDAVKYSPVGMVKGLADMIRVAASGANPLAGMADANAKLLDKAKASFGKGDYGQALGHFINYLAPGGAAMEDISQDLEDGNYGHAAAKFSGLASNLLTPKILPAAGAAADAVSTAANKLRSVIPDTAPVIPAAISDAAGIVAPQVSHAMNLYNRGAKAFNAVRAARTAPAPEATAPPVAPDASAPAQGTLGLFTPAATPPEAAPVIPVRAPNLPQPPAYAATPEDFAPGPVDPTGRPVSPYGPSDGWEPGPPGTPAPAARWEPNTLTATTPDGDVVSQPAIAPQPAISPAISDAQRLEDKADWQANKQAFQAEARTWENRAAKADRFARFLAKNKLDPTPENLAAATRELVENDPPSDETTAMIHDRMKYEEPAASAAAPAPDAPSELEQQLRDSIASAQAAKTIAPVVPQSAADALLERSKAAFDAAKGPQPGSLAQLDPNTIKADPVRFQFKRDTGGAAGVSDKLKSVGSYNPDLGGILNVWRDPADGNTYVINGHHRLELAQRSNAPSVDVRYIDAANAVEARAKGALINIAEDQGTAIDAAKLFRDTGITPADLKTQGISINGKVARAGLGLSNLDQSIFDQVISGDIPTDAAATIGEMLPGRFADQRAVMDSIDKAAARGNRMTPSQISESIRVGMRPGNDITETQDTLFGSVSQTRSLFAETGEISDYVRKQLSSEKRLFGTVASQSAADRLAGAGNKINAGENSRIASETSQAQAVYDKLSGMSGSVSDALANGARELAAGGNSNAIKASTYDAVRKAISETLSGTKAGVSGGLPPGGTGGIGQTAEPGGLFGGDGTLGGLGKP